MKKNMKKFIVTILVLVTFFTSTFLHYEKTKALGLEIALGAGIVIFVGGCCVACDILVNPDKYKDLRESMKDFGNATVENQKKLYEIEKANYQMVMQKAVDTGVGSCIVGSDGKLYSATQLQAQEYPSFDTWKGYKEKESQKPKKSLSDKFKLVSGFADFICKLWPDGKSPLPDGGSGSEQRYYTGDDGYIDRKTGAISITMNTLDLRGNLVDAEFYVATNRYNLSGAKVLNDDNEKEKIRVCSYVEGGVGTSDRYENGIATSFFRVDVRLASPKFGYSGSGYLHNLMADWEYTTNLWNGSDYTGDSLTYKNTSSDFRILYSCQLNNPYDAFNIALTDWDMVSCNIPIFDNYTHASSYVESGSLDGLLNGYFGGSDPTPTVAPAPPSTVSPVRQYVNYFTNTFSPSVMPYHVNYNIVNNWDGDTNTFNINNYTVEESDDSGVTVTPTPNLRKPTFTPIPHNTDDGDTTNNYDINITNNILIEQTNIIQEINQTVTNIYNFFIIDVDVVREEINNTEVLPTDNFENFVNTFGDLRNMFGDDLQENITEPNRFGIYYPKLKVQSPVILSHYVPDEVKLIEDGKIYIVLCDCSKYAVQFSAVRTLLKALIWFGFIFYLLKQLQVVITLNG